MTAVMAYLTAAHSNFGRYAVITGVVNSKFRNFGHPVCPVAFSDRQRVNCCVARAQAGVLLSRLKFALPGWAQAEGRRAAEQRARFAQRAEQARAYSGEGRHSEEWGWSFGRPAH